MSHPAPRILGVGYSVPPTRRGNNDPIFEHFPKGSDLFTGYTTRAVLAPGEDLMTIMVPAVLNALQEARLAPSDIDMIMGCASVGPYVNPSELSRLHQMLRFPARTWVMPLNNDFSNFNAGLVCADALVRAGRANHVLVVVGGNWTRHVSYRTPQSISAADGAGAAVVGMSPDRALWQVVDQHTVADTSFFGSMYMQGERYEQQPPRDGHEGLWSDPWFHITAEGIRGFGAFGGRTAPTAVIELLARHGIPPSAVTLIGHQASTVLFDMWRTVLQPAQMIETIQNFANMTVANIAVNLAWSVEHDPITQDNLVLFALAYDMHANAVLLQRQRPAADRQANR